uniref:GUN4-like domain-containing protein n=1 Tax=Dicranema revolutum TaxID=239144 RepID=A0A4D6WRW7_9FLOR|nr:hypothetical protein [Dicranema revolutum]
MVKEKIIQLKNTFLPNQQLDLVQQIVAGGVNGQEALFDLLVNRRITKQLDLSSLDGILFQSLYSSEFESIQQKIKYHFSNGIVECDPSLKADYQYLQNLLIQQNYQEADRITQMELCKLVGLDKNKTRNWLYFTDISLISSNDLELIDLLWRIYSRDKFGFSKQRQIWLDNHCNWEKFWLQIGWKFNGVPRRYPYEFIWDIEAPQGHLPLCNQLRGVQVLFALFNHIAWNK